MCAVPNKRDPSSSSGRHNNNDDTDSSGLRLMVCASGICVCYWFYGFLQEKLMTKSRLGATFILVIQTISNCFVALIWQQIEKMTTLTTTTTTTAKTTRFGLNHLLLLVTSTCYVCAMVGSNESVKYVSYPVAVLAKSCKLIPTMVMGSFIEQRKYSTQQWSASVMISAGIFLFNYSRLPHKQEQQHLSHDDTQYWKGMLLLVISLTMDGFLSACQGILKKSTGRLRPPTAVETMMYINLYSLLFLWPMAVTSGQWNEGIRLLKDNEQLRLSLTILNIVVSAGQIFIFLSITWFSSLITTTITTTRKFFTILFSVLHFGHSFSYGQWTSVLMVFSGLYLSIISNGENNKAITTSDQNNKTGAVKTISDVKKTN